MQHQEHGVKGYQMQRVQIKDKPIAFLQSKEKNTGFIINSLRGKYKFPSQYEKDTIHTTVKGHNPIVVRSPRITLGGEIEILAKKEKRPSAATY